MLYIDSCLHTEPIILAPLPLVAVAQHLHRSVRSADPARLEQRSSASEQGELNRLSALPQGQAAELGQVLGSFDDGQEVIASELPDLAGETDTAIGEQGTPFL